MTTHTKEEIFSALQVVGKTDDPLELIKLCNEQHVPLVAKHEAAKKIYALYQNGGGDTVSIVHLGAVMPYAEIQTKVLIQSAITQQG